MNGVSGKFGRDMGLMHEVVVTGRSAGATRQFWKAIAHDIELFKRLVSLVDNERTFPVIVDYDQTLKQMMVAGRYKQSDVEIISNSFQINGKGKKQVTIELLYFDEPISCGGALREITKQGYRPARIEELIGLGTIHPASFAIALGSVVRDGRKRAPCLSRDFDGRTPCISLVRNWRSMGSCFAVVRNGP